MPRKSDTTKKGWLHNLAVFLMVPTSAEHQGTLVHAIRTQYFTILLINVFSQQPFCTSVSIVTDPGFFWSSFCRVRFSFQHTLPHRTLCSTCSLDICSDPFPPSNSRCQKCDKSVAVSHFGKGKHYASCGRKSLATNFRHVKGCL